MSFTKEEINYFNMLEEIGPGTELFDDMTENALYSDSRWLQWMIKRMEEVKSKKPIRTQKAKEYRYLITFTLAPKNFANKSVKIKEELYSKIEAYIKGLATSKQYDATHWAVVRELTKAGNPHWHVSVVSNTWIKQSYFRYYERVYGRVDVSASKLPQKEYALNYMSKEDDFTVII